MPCASAPLRSLAWAALLGLASCSRAPRYAEHVTDAGQGRFWAAGSEGYAAFYDGTTLHRHDYPRVRGAHDGAYEHAPIPAARVVLRRDEPFLFTRHGEVHQWKGASWQRLPVRFPAPDPAHMQVDEVQLTADDRWVVYLHSDTLLTATHQGLLEGRFDTERTPTYCTWLGVIGSKVYALGWDGSGNQRALHRLDGPARWHSVTLPSREVYGVVRTPLHEIAVLGDDGQLIVVEREGEDLAPTPRPLLGKGSYFRGVTRTRSGASLLEVFGQDKGLIELGPTGHTLWQFPGEVGFLAGAFDTPKGPVALTQTGEVRAPSARVRLGPAVKDVAGP